MLRVVRMEALVLKEGLGLSFPPPVCWLCSHGGVCRTADEQNVTKSVGPLSLWFFSDVLRQGHHRS